MQYVVDMPKRSLPAKGNSTTTKDGINPAPTSHESKPCHPNLNGPHDARSAMIITSN